MVVNMFYGKEEITTKNYYLYTMEINFTTKEERKKMQEVEFLALSGAERVFAFFKLCYEMRDFPSNEASVKKNNFIIDFSTKNNLDKK